MYILLINTHDQPSTWRASWTVASTGSDDHLQVWLVICVKNKAGHDVLVLFVNDDIAIYYFTHSIIGLLLPYLITLTIKMYIREF